MALDEWISVDERLPESGIDVLGFVDGYMMQVRYIDENPSYEFESYWLESYGSEPVTPSHWQPLPTPPVQ